VILVGLLPTRGCGQIGGPATRDGDIDGGADEVAADADADPAAEPDAPLEVEPPCTEGDARIEDPADGSCYFFVQTGLSWAGARAACLALGAHLATAADQAENDLFSSIAPAVAGSGLEDVWIGGTDAAVEATFVWDSGEPLVFENWRQSPLEPNDGNDGPLGPKIEDCMIIEGDTGGLWDDRDCVRLFPYMCERD
jgi:hypothetical protein